ncbi:transcription-repair coupling factor [Candidatus Peregrinibacteria bacterium]|jgi:transcription-repair coupling factor (superfamily II helicase)|nr:transcription-repair coupling factor [Candidatus Peregrinibacteria bacterium]
MKFPHPRNQEVLELFGSHRYVTLSGGGNFSSKAFVISDILDQFNDVKKMVWVVNNNAEQENVARVLGDWVDFDIEIFDEEGGHESQVRSLAALSSTTSQKTAVILTYQQILNLYPRKYDIQQKLMTVKISEDIDSEHLFETLIDMDYEVSEDPFLEKGTYLRHGDVIDVFPVNSKAPIRIELDFDKIAAIYEYKQGDGFEKIKDHKKFTIYPRSEFEKTASIWDHLGEGTLLVEDELDLTEDLYREVDEVLKKRPNSVSYVLFTSFLEESDYHFHLHYLSVLKYQNKLDFLENMKEKELDGWRVYLFTKNGEEIKSYFDDRRINYVDDPKDLEDDRGGVVFFELEKEDPFPHSFQNPHVKFALITDREIMGLREGSHRDPAQHAVFLDFLTGLKIGDYVVHSDHGIARFNGLDKRTIDEVTREYLHLAYAENDKLFVPIDQADKVSKFIGAGDHAPKLTRLGSAEWSTITNKVKKETQSIAKELLKLYAERQRAIGHQYKEGGKAENKFAGAFPYEETPGQLRAIQDVAKDMEGKKPMDRLVCGDVGFGKTEVAMRAAFQAAYSGKQVAVISPITILADQHYKSFTKRMSDFPGIRIEMLSRFKTQAEQKKIVEKLGKGEVDIIIGTHRLIQADIKFKDLGLVVIDEEQRFGVKQKERFKELRREVDILTLTATPIPRTLNISLHGLRDITTITTPPPGRLPIITEVRRFSFGLIREAIMREIERGGQVYFLHNRVQTIDEMSDRLKKLVPEAKFITAHGKLNPTELEKRIMAFKEKEYDVLVSSTIIENGIDLANANTLIVNKAEKFGLAQLYQLRGRVGRGKRQAYAYFLYHSQRLPLDAKKRLRAIVEASELGAGFQIAMKDLEIRGAGDILGANQHGAIQVVGVSHFIRMLNQAVDNLKEGREAKASTEAPKDVSIEIPLPAFIPDDYIVSAKDKIGVYQRLAAADNFGYLSELKEDLIEDYGKMPTEVANLFNVLELKLLAKEAGLTNIRAENIHGKGERTIILSMSDKVRPENILSLLEFNKKWLVSGSKLKITFEDVGVNWVDGLKQSLKELGKKLKNRPGAEVEK